MSKFERPI